MPKTMLYAKQVEERIDEAKQDKDGYPRHAKKSHVRGALYGKRAYADIKANKILYDKKDGEKGLWWKPFRASDFKYTLIDMGVPGARAISQTFNMQNDTWYLALDEDKRKIAKRAYEAAKKGKFNLKDMVGGSYTGFPEHALGWSVSGFKDTTEEDKHFNKHAHEFGLDTSKASDKQKYLKMALDFFNSPLTEHDDMFVARVGNGWLVYRYNDDTKCIGVANAGGTEITFHSLEYDRSGTKRTNPAKMFQDWINTKKEFSGKRG